LTSLPGDNDSDRHPVLAMFLVRGIEPFFVLLVYTLNELPFFVQRGVFVFGCDVKGAGVFSILPFVQRYLLLLGCRSCSWRSFDVRLPHFKLPCFSPHIPIRLVPFFAVSSTTLI
jgi:hypothetical protein